MQSSICEISKRQCFLSDSLRSLLVHSRSASIDEFDDKSVQECPAAFTGETEREETRKSGFKLWPRESTLHSSSWWRSQGQALINMAPFCRNSSNNWDSSSEMVESIDISRRDAQHKKIWSCLEAHAVIQLSCFKCSCSRKCCFESWKRSTIPPSKVRMSTRSRRYQSTIQRACLHPLETTRDSRIAWLQRNK